VERAKQVIFSAIAKTLFNLYKGKGLEELPKVVWSHNTIASKTTSFTPFKLLYYEEAMLPEEARHQSLHVIKQALAEEKNTPKKQLRAQEWKQLKTLPNTKTKPKNGETAK